ncbi:hypothetical protein EJ03DRAFT_342215 [Teratosphaeria nubilosa]|uniref:Glycosyl transferase n=1 Tax=Teratosphaeria nubilosa TaxID=161662 RepID=A0A6G1LGA1_9PEZI|nr:hypothetical protein EJ03DRAFT_342215 [Teratosphaeria nubilosa]
MGFLSSRTSDKTWPRTEIASEKACEVERRERDTSHGKIGQFCDAHGFQEYDESRHGPRARRIYDLFLISTELDWLEIRLHTLSPYVDYFVIVESRTTFTGLEKPAYLEENWERFAAFHHKIIHRVVEDPGEAVGSRTWDHEDYMRNALFNSVFPSLSGTEEEAQNGDVLIVGDIDEVTKPETLFVLRKCAIPERLTLRSHFYYYSFQWLHRGQQWAHPQATIYKGISSTISPKDLRNGEGPHGWLFLGDIQRWWQKSEIWNASWHCSSCLATVAEMQAKMNSFSHSPLNTESNRDGATIVERVRIGLDLFGRPTEVYDRVENNQDVPGYIKHHTQRFGYLLDRDGPNAGFTDVAVGE